MNHQVLICGGAGFIGTNLATRLLGAGKRVLIYDDLSRPGVENNLEWLRRLGGDLLDFELADIRDARALRRCVRSAAAVFHLAAQTAVTTSLVSPREDFEINAGGTLSLLEQLRDLPRPVPLVFTSTNKVYGNLERIALHLQGSRYEPQHPAVAASGIDERWPLDFHSPYGCSKGAADQYVLDYARTYRLPNVVFRMSCIYGPYQCGNEDQGWVAHFLLRALRREPITVFGDGRQVRDILFAEDLVDAMLFASRAAHNLAGRAFNIGGGPSRAVSLYDVLDIIACLDGRRPDVRFEDWRIGDQRYYVSDTRAFQAASGWAPRVAPQDGIARLYAWLCESQVSLSSGVLQRGVA